jgi:hypothetical protein
MADRTDGQGHASGGRKPLLQQLPGHHHALDLVRSLVDLGDLGVAHSSAPAWAIVVTSRDTLPGLVARDGAARLDPDALPLGEAVAPKRPLRRAGSRSLDWPTPVTLSPRRSAAHYEPLSTCRAMTIRWIWLVPSWIWVIVTSGQFPQVSRRTRSLPPRSPRQTGSVNLPCRTSMAEYGQSTCRPGLSTNRRIAAITSVIPAEALSLPFNLRG